YTGLLRHMLTLRDQHCRTPWCDAPIRHIDHIHRRTNGGPTSYRNGRGVCAGCNHAREAPGWTATVTSGIDEPHHVTLTTPTGHTYPATPPPLIPTTRPAAGPGVPKLSTTEPRAGPRRTRAG
ncbi:MAG TPA: HNH endonuclease, partial [Intrasporangiaceae bacterium]|nr:HNH endonuclease [Intrasporangiaceae bacterium]